MIIHQPELIVREGQAILWSKIELDNPHQNFPEVLWYRVPEEYHHYLSPQSDPFLLPGLIGGMYFGEKVTVRGTVSPRLAYHLDEYQYLLNFRLSGAVRPVEIAYERLAPMEGQPIGVGSTFSGGVDSFHTLWTHKPENQLSPEFQITHLTFIMGFDIIQAKEAKYRRLLGRYKRALQEINVELIPIETNAVRMVVPRLHFNNYVGAILAGLRTFSVSYLNVTSYPAPEIFTWRDSGNTPPIRCRMRSSRRIPWTSSTTRKPSVEWRR